MRLVLAACVICVALVICSCGVSYHLEEESSLSEVLVENSVSPNTGCHQGYATDGVSHFVFDTTRILKRADDATWHISAVNDVPFAGLSGYNHLGDGDHFEGKLYVAAERYASCTDHDNPSVLVYDASTLTPVAEHQLGGGQEISGVAIEPEQRRLWASSFCDANRLWVYDLDSMKFLRTVELSPAVENIQGLTFHGGFIYVAQNSGAIRKMYLDGISKEVYRTDLPGAHEGLDYSQKELRWLIDAGAGEKKVHYLTPRSAAN